MLLYSASQVELLIEAGVLYILSCFTGRTQSISRYPLQ